MNEHAYDVDENERLLGFQELGNAKAELGSKVRRFYLGIDPGKTGGLALLDSEGAVASFPMPSTELDLYNLLAGWPVPEHAFLEKVHSTPQMGVKSAFSFGRNYGMLLGILTSWQIPFTEVRPQEWQKAMQCMSGGDKNVTKRRAQQLFPKMKITHATAEALLIAAYCRQSCQMAKPAAEAAG